MKKGEDKFIDMLSALDKFGMAVNLKFKNSSLYKTKLGLFLTIASYAIVTAYLAVQVNNVL